MLTFDNKVLIFDDHGLDDTPYQPPAILNISVTQGPNGTLSASQTTGRYGDVILLSNTANNGYEFTNYSITGATLTGNRFELQHSDVNVAANYTYTGIKVPIRGAIDYEGARSNSGMILNDFTLVSGDGEWTVNGSYDMDDEGRAVNPIFVTAFNGVGGAQAIRPYSSYYDMFTIDTHVDWNTLYTIAGWKGDIVITAVEFYHDFSKVHSAISYPVKDLHVRVAPGYNGPWQEGGYVIRNDVRVFMTGLEVHTKNTIGTQMSFLYDQSVPYYEGKSTYNNGYFSGYMLV